MFRLKAILILLALSAFIFNNSQNCSALTCGPRLTVLESFERANLVVITKVVSIINVREQLPISVPTGYLPESVQMIVEKVYKGDVKIGDELRYLQGVGQDYVFPLKEKGNCLAFLNQDYFS